MTFMTKFINLLIVLTCIICSACNDYLNIPPKGSKIPTTLADFEALLRDQYTNGRTPILNALYLLNDVYLKMHKSTHQASIGPTTCGMSLPTVSC